MGYFKKYSQFISEAYIVDPDLEDIRHFHGSIQQFKDFWERKMKVSFNPRTKVEYQYPTKRTEEDKSLPYQDFINGNSEQVKYLLKNRKRGINTENK